MVIPNLSLILIVSYGILEGEKRGRGLGLFIGLTQDFLFFHTASFTGLLYYYIGHLSGYFNKDFYKENYILPLFLLAAGDLLYSLVCYSFCICSQGIRAFCCISRESSYRNWSILRFLRCPAIGFYFGSMAESGC
ncbi:MAG: rod shape-determining protein MreD [Clostridia bacterium]